MPAAAYSQTCFPSDPTRRPEHQYDDETPQNTLDRVFDQFFPSGLFGDGRKISLTAYAGRLARETRADARAIAGEADATVADIVAHRFTDPDDRFGPLPSTIAADERARLEMDGPDTLADLHAQSAADAAEFREELAAAAKSAIADFRDLLGLSEEDPDR
jgi:hypothetical protein